MQDLAGQGNRAHRARSGGNTPWIASGWFDHFNIQVFATWKETLPYSRTAPMDSTGWLWVEPKSRLYAEHPGWVYQVLEFVWSMLDGLLTRTRPATRSGT